MRVSVLQQPTPRVAPEPAPRPIVGLGGRGLQWDRIHVGPMSGQPNPAYYERLPSGRWLLGWYGTNGGPLQISDDESTWGSWQNSFPGDEGMSTVLQTLPFSIGGSSVLAFRLVRPTPTTWRTNVIRSDAEGRLGSWSLVNSTTFDGWDNIGASGYQGQKAAILDDGSLLVASGNAAYFRSVNQGVAWTMTRSGEAIEALGFAHKGPVVVGCRGGSVIDQLVYSSDYGQTFGYRQKYGSEHDCMNFLRDGYLYSGIRGNPPSVARLKDWLSSDWTGKWEGSQTLPTKQPDNWKISWIIDAPWGGILATTWAEPDIGELFWCRTWPGPWTRVGVTDLFSWHTGVGLFSIGGVVYWATLGGGLYRSV